jgi:hypothetical protein
MYINQVDELLDQIIDNFHDFIQKTKIIPEITKDQNFVKYNNRINDIIRDFTKSVDIKKIESLINSKDSINTIYDVIKRYCAFYIFFVIAYYYDDKRDLFITNIIETSKYQKDSKFKINNFFNSETNGILSKYFNLIKNIQVVAKFKTMDKIKMYLSANINRFNHLTEFFDSLDEELIVNYFLIDNNMHYIIKQIIFGEIYVNNEKNDIIRILNQKEEEDGEYREIDVVVTTKDKTIDLSSLENAFTTEQVKSGIVEQIYNFLLESQKKLKEAEVLKEQKVNFLFQKKVLIPITEDFVRFHKDTEKYESDNDLEKEKSATRAKLVLSKINNIRNYYSKKVVDNEKLKKEIANLFYLPLNHRDAVTYNDFEEMKIISKLKNTLDKNSGELQDYLLEIENFRRYAYMNYKDFKNDGFKLRTSDSVEAIRYTNIKHNKNNQKIETRIGNDVLDINVIGVAINTTDLPLACLTNQKLIDSKKLTKSKNGYTSFTKMINHFSSKNKKSIFYWLFDVEHDKAKLNTYQNISMVNKSRSVIYLLEIFYDFWVEHIMDKLTNIIKQRRTITLWDLDIIIKKEKQIDFERHPELKQELIGFVFDNKLENITVKYDENEDSIPGSNGKIIKLPKYKKISNNKKMIVVKKYEDEEFEIKLDAIHTICNHYVQWEKIKGMVKDTKRYTQTIFDFTKQYVKESDKGEYICKSCNEILDIKKYVYEGHWDADTETFTTTNIAITKSLKDLPQYEKFTRTIRNLESNIIEKLSMISNYTYLIGNTPIVKLRRKVIIKDTIDLLLEHNKSLKGAGEKRRELAFKKYGIEKEFSTIFFFELKDDIFLTSSKDTDYYKKLKYNNILVYILFFIICELNLGQIRNLKEDKTCNYFRFDKGGKNLFANLSIRINEREKANMLKNYPLLCYVLFYFSCLMISHKMWLFDWDDKFNIAQQKSIIHTTVDLINSLIEETFKEEKSFLYDIVTKRFLIKLFNTYNNTEILEYLNTEVNKKIKFNTETNKLSFAPKKIRGVPLNGTWKASVRTEYKPVRCEASTFIMPVTSIKQISEIDFLTNCSDGKFHNWTFKNGIMSCQNCGKVYSELIKTSTIKKSDIIDKIRYNNLIKKTKKYCISGKEHEIDIKTGICSLCNINQETHKYILDELKNLEKSLQKIRDEKSINMNINSKKLIEEKNVKTLRDKKYITTLTEEYQKINFTDYCEQFIQKLVNIVGDSIKTESGVINLKDTTYVLNHNYFGSDIKEEKLITSDKITIKRNHPDFDRDVLYYLDKNNNTTVFYDPITLKMLGYQESNRKINKLVGEAHLQSRWSILKKIQILGSSNSYLQLNYMFSDYSLLTPDEIEEKKIGFFEKIIQERISNLKQVIYKLQTAIQKIKFKNNLKIKHNDNIGKIGKEYSQKIRNINLSDKNDDNTIFSDWKRITDNIFSESIEKNVDYTIKSKFLDLDIIRELNNNDNLLIYYILKNLSMLIDYNDGMDKTNTGHFIIVLINQIFMEYYIPLNDTNLRKFEYKINSKAIVQDENIHIVGIYNEIVSQEELNSNDTREENYDASQAESSFDVGDYDEDEDDFYFDNFNTDEMGGD